MSSDFFCHESDVISDLDFQMSRDKHLLPLQRTRRRVRRQHRPLTHRQWHPLPRLQTSPASAFPESTVHRFFHSNCGLFVWLWHSCRSCIEYMLGTDCSCDPCRLLSGASNARCAMLRELPKSHSSFVKASCGRGDNSRWCGGKSRRFVAW